MYQNSSDLYRKQARRQLPACGTATGRGFSGRIAGSFLGENFREFRGFGAIGERFNRENFH